MSDSPFGEALFAERTVIVTGAGWGLGRGIAHAFAAHGAMVWGCDLNEPEPRETQRASPRPMQISVVDVTNGSAVNEFVRQVIERSGGCDTLINDAGGLCGQEGRPIEDVPEADFNAILRANVNSTFLLTRAVAASMKSRKFGRIVNISSGARLSLTVTNIRAYTAAKAAVIGFTRQLAHELGPFGITVNCVAPGMVPCNPYASSKWQALSDVSRREALDKVATRRVGRPEDIAYAVLFFASNGASWISGQTLLVDGGR